MSTFLLKIVPEGKKIKYLPRDKFQKTPDRDIFREIKPNEAYVFDAELPDYLNIMDTFTLHSKAAFARDIVVSNPTKLGNNERTFAELKTESWPLPLTFQIGLALDLMKNTMN